ncbi:MAG: TonB-dependent receptor domain-containing protein [Candidatus Eremiobacter antarcticus]|nr:TonB-dependent receptor [Candidatus Eremiobacteraeota bacterium]MBC5808393.1 TonB-dependent receptor [Candidatus Eremiobacteraeota bacterium]
MAKANREVVMHHARRFIIALGLAFFVGACAGSVAMAGTTGGISGRVLDSATRAPVAGVKVTAVAPSESATSLTDASGSYSFVSLGPDTYTLTASKDGYDVTVQHGVTVLADQTQTVTISVTKSPTVIGRINVVGTTGLLKPGTTSDIYSVNPAGQAAAVALAGSGNLNQAYSAMASVPGVSSVQGQQGWYQPVYIRGGDLDQVGWEFDGIPVNRTYDNAPQTFLSNLGQQELQVYTGGTSANADASGIAGYVNQVIKRGTRPGFGNLDVGIGAPVFYNKASIEAGGATPDQKFSYYAGLAKADQSFRYLDQSNGAGHINQGFFYPISPGAGTGPEFGPGYMYGIADTRDGENVANFHLRVGQSDDLQLLYLTSYLWFDIPSSLNDLYGANTPYSTINANQGFAVTYADGAVYQGALMQPPVQPANPCHDPSGNIGDSPYGVCYLYPSTPHFYGAPIDRNLRDTNVNTVSITKLQYQKNFSSRSYLRLFGYGMYSEWFIHGPLAPVLLFDASLGDYELPSHTYGVVADYSNQLNDKHLVTLSGYYSTTRIQRYTTTGGFPGNSAFVAVTSDVSSGGNCFDPVNGVQVFCVAPSPPHYRGPYTDAFGNQVQGTLQDPFAGVAVPAVGQWLVTETGYRANFNKLNPVFSALSINDNWKPTDRLTFNIGARIENYRNNLTDNTVNGFPARAFWFNAYNNEFCYAPGYFQPLQKINSPTDSCAADWPLTTPIHMVNENPGSFSHTEFQPRFGTTYSASSDDIFRFSAGLYSRPASTREASWNVTEQNLAAFLGVNFAAYGQFTPNHDVRPDRSSNFDISWEHHFAGSDTSFKVTPFYRSTQDQVQQIIINALSGLFGSFNTGRQTVSGVEFALQKGSFANNGWAYNLAFTHTNSHIRYNSFSNGRNVIDNMNAYIQLYNSYTSACAGAVASSDATSRCGVFGGAEAFATEPNAAANPYFLNAPQPLLDRNAEYAPYDLVPVPFAAANGYEVPNVASLIVNYKSGPLSLTPSLTYSSGSVYGSPLSWPGPQPFAPGDGYGVPLMIPDPYTGKFDNFGDFRQPTRLTLNMGIGYDVSKNVHAALTLTNIVDQCNQRGYAWDYAGVCTYSSLPSSFLSPTGGMLGDAAAGPVQLKFPYAMWLNNNNTGFVGVKIPMQASLNVRFKI